MASDTGADQKKLAIMYKNEMEEDVVSVYQFSFNRFLPLIDIIPDQENQLLL